MYVAFGVDVMIQVWERSQEADWWDGSVVNVPPTVPGDMNSLKSEEFVHWYTAANTEAGES